MNYNTRTMCVLRGSSVNISCTYSPLKPREIKDIYWYAWSNNKEPTDLQTEPEYKGRVEYPVNKTGHTLKITELRDTDSAEYRFKYRSERHDWESTLHGVTLNVTGTTDC